MKRLLLFAALCGSLAFGQTSIGPIATPTIKVGVGGITGVPGADVGSGPIPLGNDPFMFGRGPADGIIGNLPYSLNSSTAVAGTGVHTITVSSTASYYTNIPSTPTTLQIEAIDAANHESLVAGTTVQCAGLTPPSGKWCIGSSTTIVANFTKTHSGTYPVWQYGGALLRAYIAAQDAQDGSHIWFFQQDASAFPYYFHWATGDGGHLYDYASTGKTFYANNFLNGSAVGLYMPGTQAVIRTGAADFTFIQDGAVSPVQQARFTNTQTDLPAKVTIGGITSSQCMWKMAATTMLGRLADDSGDCPITGALITGKNGLDANSIGIGHAGPITGATTFNASGLATVGGISTGGTPTANHAVCWKTSTTLSYCTTVVAADGTCTCN